MGISKAPNMHIVEINNSISCEPGLIGKKETKRILFSIMAWPQATKKNKHAWWSSRILVVYGTDEAAARGEFFRQEQH